MARYDKVYIYFDTNVLEARHHDKLLFLSQIRLSKLYYEVENLVKNLELQDKVFICIPEVVWLELLNHMHQCFVSEKQSLNDKIEVFRKTFGDLVEVNLEFGNISNEAEYVQYLENISKTFFEETKILAKKIPYPKNETILDVLLEKAISSISPFTKVKSNKKDYTDAGFKDALIYETMIQNTKDGIGILVTDDNDFNDAFGRGKGEQFKCVKTLREVEDILVSTFQIVDNEYLESKFRNNDYMLSRILLEAGMTDDVNCLFVGIDSIQEVEQGKQIVMRLRINGDVRRFTVLYNDVANELMEAKCTEEK